ncbi:MAG: hypothetical protein ABIP69_00850 [Ferruginibacter sp.]
MEKNINAAVFFVKILQSFAWLVLWMVIQIFIGVYLNYAFFESSPNWTNIIYYIFLIVTGYFVFRIILKKWKA